MATKSQKNQTADPLAQLDRIRTEIAAKLEALEKVRKAPLPLEDARAQIREWVAREAERFDTPVSYFAHEGFTGPLSLATLPTPAPPVPADPAPAAPAARRPAFGSPGVGWPTDLTYRGGEAAQPTVPSLPIGVRLPPDVAHARVMERAGVEPGSSALTSLFCALFPDRIEELLAERLERLLADLPLVLSTQERVERVAALTAELHALEVGEERLIRELEDGGVEAFRRTEARPAVVLAIDLDQVAPPPEARGA